MAEEKLGVAENHRRLNKRRRTSLAVDISTSAASAAYPENKAAAYRHP
jgi:hypothetical protein